MTEIGEFIHGEQERDAIHIAVAPVVAAHNLKAGEHIGFVYNDNRTVGSLSSKPIGIVDPFLTEEVKKGQQFWMFLYPNTITSLKHNWTHPDFDSNAESIGKAKAWIKEWALEYGWTYDRAMEAGKNRDFFIGEVYYDQIPVKFWINYETITGEHIDKETREGTYFHCAC